MNNAISFIQFVCMQFFILHQSLLLVQTCYLSLSFLSYHTIYLDHLSYSSHFIFIDQIQVILFHTFYLLQSIRFIKFFDQSLPLSSKLNRFILQMIKEQDHPENPHQLWTFNDAGSTFTIKKNKNIFNFKLCNTFTNRWHQSEDIELQRINEQTIKAAFDPKIDSVSYELTQKSQKSINLQFTVKIEYLATNFYEDIEMKEIEMDKKQEMKMQMEELLNETNKLHELAEKEFENKEKNIHWESTAFNTRSGKMSSTNLKPGKYFFSATGAFISEKIYNGEYYDDGMGNYNYDGAAQFPLRLRIKIGKNEPLEFVSGMPKFQDSYEYPYNISGIFEVKDENEVEFTFDGYKVDENVMMNGNVLTVSPISLFNDLA